MGQVSGGKTVIAVYDETAFKTPGTNGMRLPLSQFNLENQQKREKSQILSGYYGEARGVKGLQGVGGTIASEAGPESMGFWLKHLIGAPVSAPAGTAFKHTFVVGEGALDLPPGITFEEDFGAVLGSADHRVLRYSGCRINKGTFNFGTQGYIGLSFDVIGALMTAAAAPLDATLTDLGHSSWSVADIGIVLSSGAVIEVCFNNLSLGYTNNLDTDSYCINGGGVRDSLARGTVGLEGQATALFDSDALLKQTLADTDASLVVSLTRGTGDGTAGNEKLVLTVPALTFDPAGVPVTGPKGLRVQGNFTAHRTVGEIGLKAELWNAVETI